MSHCPHCGEPVDDGAYACPHCGSDYETGWNPDADYLSTDLPDDEASSHRGHVRPKNSLAADAVIGGGLVFLAGTVFFWVVTRTHQAEGLVLAILLTLGWFYSRELLKREKSLAP